ncbi:hypothetical protein J6590_006184 [Homalodisca vitripennis]|nr:hypothetical protein J6590_006184 [Homalodisca vitripennis]
MVGFRYDAPLEFIETYGDAAIEKSSCTHTLVFFQQHAFPSDKAHCLTQYPAPDTLTRWPPEGEEVPRRRLRYSARNHSLWIWVGAAPIPNLIHPEYSVTSKARTKCNERFLSLLSLEKKEYLTP